MARAARSHPAGHLLQKTELNARQRDYLKKIQLSGEHLLGIINDILDFSKIEAGKLSVETTEFEIDSVLENVANLIGEKASEKGLELIYDLSPATMSCPVRKVPRHPTRLATLPSGEAAPIRSG